MKLQDRNLSTQMNGADVKLLQSELRLLGFVIADKEIDSALFGESTRQAVLEFQKKFGLKTTGVVDDVSAKRINSEVDALRPPPEQIVTHKVIGQLLDQKTGAPLPGLTVNAFDLDADKEPKALGPATTDDQGMFALVHTSDAAKQQSAKRRLGIHVLNQQAREVFQTEIQVEPDSGKVIQIRVPMPQTGKPGSPALKDLVNTLKLELPRALLPYLAGQGINTLADIRTAGGISHLDGLPVPKDSPVVKMLEAHANLELLSPDAQTNTKLIEKGYTGVEAIARVSRPDFVKGTHQELGDFKAAQMQTVAQAQAQFLGNVLTQLRADFANGVSIAIDHPRVQSLFEERCRCADCEAAVSPLAYLADLLDYALTHLINEGSPITLRFLTATFHQPFGDFPVSCKSAEEPVRQVRICTEVLRSYLGTRRASPQRVREEQEYRLAAYASLLAGLGTSPQELRLARTGDESERANLAERLGVAPGRLNELSLDPAAITERALENIFGLFDTTRNPLASRSTPALQSWQIEQLRALWQSEDWPEDWAAEVRPPIIDPDLIGPQDLRNPVTGDAAFSLWRERRDWVADRLRRLESAHASAGSNALAGVVEMLRAAGLPSLEALRELDEQRRRGNNITSRLAELNLSVEAFSRLLRVAHLIERGLTPDNSEWEDVAFILVQANKRAQFPTWRRQEQEARITLSPAHFNILEPSAEFPSEEPAGLPAWRATWDAQRRRRETLQSRIDQEKTVAQALREAVSRAEEATLPMLRDALVKDIPHAGDLNVKAKWVTDYLLIDAQASGCQMSTRVAQAIETLQALLFSVRTEQLRDTYPALELDADDFDAEWEWVGSYAAWRAGMFVFLYPENILLPGLRKWQTPAFRKLVSDLRANRQLTPEQACASARDYSDYYRDILSLTLEASCRARTRIHKDGGCRSRSTIGHRHLLYFFARSTGRKVYWSACDPKDESGYAQTFWHEVPGLRDVTRIPGAQPYYISPERRFIYLFAQTAGGKLVFTKYDLELALWDQEPTELEIKIGDRSVTSFTAVVGQYDYEAWLPFVYVSTPDGIHSRSLNTQGNNWDDLDWRSPRLSSDPSFPPTREILAACVSRVGGEGYYVVRSTSGQLLVSTWFSGRRYTIGTGPFRGAFIWPESPDLCVLSGEGASASYNIATPSSLSVAGRFPESLGLERACWISGLVNDPEFFLGTPFAFQRNDGQIERRNLTRSVTILSPGNAAPLAPTLRDLGMEAGTLFEITGTQPGDDLQIRRALIESAFRANEGSPQSNRAYLEEAFYFVPLQVALQLQQRGQYTAALDWFRTVYDYSAPRTERKVYYGLTLEGSLSSGYRRADDWLLDPLNPHAIAATRRNAYTRFTIISLIRCLLEFADAEFTRDTAESLPRARILYLTALELLDLPELKQNLFRCDDLIGELSANVTDPQWQHAWRGMMGGLLGIDNLTSLSTAVSEVRRAIDAPGSWEDRMAAAQAIVIRAKEGTGASPTMGEVLNEESGALAAAYATLLAQPDIAKAIERVGETVSQDFLYGVAYASGMSLATLEKEMVELPWLREKAAAKAIGDSAIAPILTLQSTRKVSPASFPRPAQAHFCIPPNPILRALRLHAELNLFKLRNCRNIAGMLRQVEPYAAPTDTVSGLPTIGAGGQLVLPGRSALRPTPYRYAVLIDRAKQLAQLAGQVEASLLSALEKRDAEYYNILKARQDMLLARAGVRLQDLRLREAEDGVGLARLQQDRAQIQADHYTDLLEGGGISALEALSLGLMAGAIVAQGLAAAAFWTRATLSFGLETGQALQATASGLQMGSSLASMFASFERRRQEWEFARNLAEQDIRIGAQQVRIAEDQVRVVGQERTIASMQTEHAEVIVDFLTNKFTNVELYDWMSNILEGVYSFFLQQATAMAQLAANQLAFERQQVPPSFIQSDYWEAPADGASSSGTDTRPADRRGLTGSTRLLQDIYQLDQYAFETNSRKLQLTKTISLARLAPAEFQRFTETGVMRFETPLELFDRDFPGHYLRLIKRVRTSVIALVPPAQGIRATLSTTGASRVVIGGDIFQTTVVRRDPESVALSSPREATGVFDLDPQPEMLLPFEGGGVGAQWEFRLPKPANMFDYGTIADVLVTIEYTALDSFDYRHQLIQQLNRERTARADRPFSFRHQFADQWYDLHNPEQTDTPMTVRFTTTREDFPPNIAELRIEQVALYFARADGRSFEVPVDRLHFIQQGERRPVGGGATSVDAIISTRRGNASAWIAIQGKAPVGEWELAVPNTEEMKGRFKNEEIEDILFVITFAGRTPLWPI